ncbi:hypothetical protein BJD99_17360 [Rhodococcus sp. 1163]|uniref:hypothetical protein n=1 Tax=unclassified Rhodococcus (in: high G+C Gram-positive bacteria) TaxID=192944 RepID=UPI000A0276B0|nr:hypothetical protein [Rhodococcus sp. 1163]ORI12240.1 hypothetical protein BJD99_17360 [Rhodococcus sp. 1163]
MFVMTVDQRRSRRDIDRVEAVLELTRNAPLLRGFERTAGDEIQAVATDAHTVVDLTLTLVRLGTWSVGIGIGQVEEPLPDSTRAGRGPAFEAARDAVTRAKNAPAAVAVTAANRDLDTPCRDAETALTLIALLITDRTEQGHEATDLMARGHTQKSAAETLGITKQAISQRLSVARWSIEASGRALAERLLTELDVTIGNH